MGRLQLMERGFWEEGESRPGREEGRVWGHSVCHLGMSYFDGAAGGKVIAEGRKD